MTLRTDDPVDQLYRATATPRLVTVPALGFLCLDGHGGPGNPDYARAVQALFAVSYAVRFAVKKAGGPAYTVSPLECLWWAEDLSTFHDGDKTQWEWRLLLRQPADVTEELCLPLAEETAASKGMPAARELRFVSFEEGAAAQVLHVGPYADEGPTIARLHAFIHEQGFVFDGHRHKHHEIYVGDPRRAAPERLRTIIRQPYAVP